jgi:Na+/proline symporter
MLLWFVVLYLMVSVGIGLFAATRVHNARDFAVAGRSLPLPVVTATVFATWFGAEAVFGVSATFVKDGLSGVVADPFGSSMCLIIAGVIFSRYLYKLNIITLGDFYRMRYNRTVEVITTICIVLSYLGWVAAQIKALGLIFFVVTDGAVSQNAGMILGAAIVLTYTVFGGMFSVAILDFVQMAVSMGGLLFIAWIVSGKVGGGATAVIDHARAAGKLDFFPAPDPWLWLTFLGTWMTMMLGSIPQQDVFQRITSAKSANIALAGSILGASIFGAVLSAIMSCSSATLLAPSVTFAENVIRGFYPGMGDHQFLRVMRGCLIVFTCIVLGFALKSESSIFKMVENAYKVTLAGAFVPLAAGIFWRRATTQGALAATFGGLVSWVLIEVLIGEASLVPPQLIGLSISILGMVAGSLLPQWVGHHVPGHDPHAILHHHAAAQTHHAEPEHRH